MASPSSLPVQLPSLSLLPQLSFTASIEKHLASSNANGNTVASADALKGEGCSKDGPRIAREIAAALATASLKHIAFARGLVSTTFAQLDKERTMDQTSSEGAQSRSRGAKAIKRDQVQRHILSAIHASSGPPASDQGLPLILVIGSSPISPKEIYYLDLETPPSSAAASSPTSDYTPPSAKLLSTLERQLIRFLISTEEISDVIMGGPLARGGGGKMSLFLFTLRSSSWRTEGWRVRRGLRLNMEGLRTIRQEQSEEEDVESAEEDRGDSQLPFAYRPQGTGTPHRQLLDDSRPSTPASYASHSSQRTDSPGSDLTKLAEALSPARRAEESNQGGTFSGRPPARPPLVARQSSYLESKGSTSNAGNKALPALRPKEIENHFPLSTSSALAPTTDKESPSPHPDPSSHLIEPLHALSLDPRPQGSRLFPPNMDMATSLLARSRLSSSSSSSSSASAQGRRGLLTSSNGRTSEAMGRGEREGNRGAGLSTGLRTVRGRAPPKGAGFGLSCSLDPRRSLEKEEGEKSSDEVHEAHDEAGDDELVLFQCEVVVPSYHP